MSSLYIHLPFCKRKCLYCSFSVVISQEHRIEDYLYCLQQEAKSLASPKIDTVYIGGGTPSRLSVSQLQILFKIVQENFCFDFNDELTLEANPEDIDETKAEALNSLGVNRISLGVETLNDRYLKVLGRVHDRRQAQNAFQILRRAGFKNINIDLMYSFPGQRNEEILDDLKAVTDLGPEHISLYSLTIEPKSRFYAQRIANTDPQCQGRQHGLVVQTLESLHYCQYEVSNFCQEGFESRHNINYWTSGNYFGLGLSSHSHVDGLRSWNVDRLREYLQRVRNKQSPQCGFEELSPPRRLSEALVFGLRMNRGVDLAHLQNRFECPLTADQRQTIQNFVNHGLLQIKENHLKATSRGQSVLDDIAVALI